MKKTYFTRMMKLNNFILSTVLQVFCLFSFAQQTYTFTNCGATGRLGPSQLQINSSYALTNLNGSVTVFGSGIQEFTVPASGPYRITAIGASGGNSTNGPAPGNGAIMSGEFNLIGGEVIRVLVGQMGQDRTFSAGGGGGSFVTRTPHNTQGSILVIAGGGGASSADFAGLSATTASCGTFDTNSGPAQCGGNGGLSFTGNSGSGGGGFFTDGQNGGIGVGGTSYTAGGFGGTTNSQQEGGFGGGGGQNGSGTYAASAGGGFSGGNGGNRANAREGGGGGGSLNNGTNQQNSVSTSTGHGRVIFEELCSVKIYASGTNSLNPTLCSGNSLTLTTDAVSNFTWSNGNTTNTSIVVSPTSNTSYSIVGTSSANCQGYGLINVVVSVGVPVLSISNPSNNVCLGRDVSLTASGALSYTWTGGVVNGQTFTPTATNSYTVTGANGCGTSTAVTTITVAPLTVTTSASSTLICEGYASTLTALAAVDGFTWEPGSLTGSTTIVAPIVNTIYTITASDGTCAGTQTIEISTKTTPTISTAALTTTICEGESVTLSASGAGIGGTYTWTPGGQTGATITVSPITSTQYAVNGTNSLSCESSALQIVLVEAAPQLQATAMPITVCSGSPVNLTASGANTFTWVAGPQTATHTVNPISSGTYTVFGNNNTNTCVATATVEVNVIEVNLTVSNDMSICEGNSATLTASGANSYAWNNAVPSPFGTQIFSPMSTTIYTVVGTTLSAGLNCQETRTVMVTVNPNPTLTVMASRQTICKGETNSLTLSGATNYSLGTNPVTDNSITINPEASTIYTITGTDENGCENSILYQSIVSPCTGISESGATMQAISVFPNPSNGTFTVKVDSEVTLLLMNNLGQVLKTISFNTENNFSADVNNISAGIYFLVGENENGMVKQKVVIQ